MELELPYPPSMNHYWRRVGNRTLLSRGGRQFRKDVSTLLTIRRCSTLTGALAVEVLLFPPDRRRRDIDNVLKALLDSLQHAGAYLDDSQITRLCIEKREVFKGGRTLVRIGNVCE